MKREVDPGHGGVDAYGAKVAEYFSGTRADYVAALPVNVSARILEVGCGEGATGALALAERKCGRYCAVELFPEAARTASMRVSEVVVGNVEHIELPWADEEFDALILSEVLEHLVDPWKVLQKLHPLLKPGATVFASSPNIAHRRVFPMLLRGEWALTDAGVMDRTHLRWFTPKTYRALFEDCGFRVESVRELTPITKKAKLVMILTGGRFRHLFISQIDLRARRA